MKQELQKIFNSIKSSQEKITEIEKQISDDTIKIWKLLKLKFKYKDIIVFNGCKYVFTSFGKIRTWDKRVSLNIWNLKVNGSLGNVNQGDILYSLFGENKHIINTGKKAT